MTIRNYQEICLFRLTDVKFDAQPAAGLTTISNKGWAESTVGRSSMALRSLVRTARKSPVADCG